MPNPPAIRPATAADIPALLPMIHALAAHHGDPPACTPEALLRDAFGPDPWVTLLLAEGAGYAALTRQVQLQTGRRGIDLHHLFVSPRSRGTGTGSALVTATCDHARSLGCAVVTVGTDPDNHAAQAFYLARGFDRIGTAPHRFRRLL
jgi:GNAT superfamily N-acetyltransferase